jgi:lysophospholipase L1-like esterase
VENFDQSLVSKTSSSHRIWCRVFKLSLGVIAACSINLNGNSLLARDVPLDQFEPEIKAFEEKDKTSPPPGHATEFVGSSSIRKWTALDDDFKEFKAFNRGFGGSTITENVHYADRIVTKYHPDKIVFYAGTNDIAAGHSARRVADDFAAFLKKVQPELPNTDIYFVSISIAPCRLQYQKDFEDTNRLVQAEIAGQPKLHFIDVRPAMLDSDGKLKQSYFGPDHLHMTRAGYEAWIPVIKKALQTAD